MISGERRSADRRPMIGRRSADTSADDIWLIYDIGRLIGRSSADRQPTIGRSSADCQNPKTVGRWKKIYNKVVIFFFCRPMKKELKSGILSADKSGDCRPTVGGVIAVEGSNFENAIKTCNLKILESKSTLVRTWVHNLLLETVFKIWSCSKCF